MFKNHHLARGLRPIFCLLLTLSAWQSEAQDFNGFVYSEYAGILGARVQPASIAGTPYQYHISLLNGNLSGSNNISEMVGGEGGVEFQRIIENDRKFMQASLSLGGLSAMVSLPGKRALGFQARFRTHVSTNNISPDFANQFQNWRAPELNNMTFKDQTGELAVAGWREISLTYAKVFCQKKRHSWKGGATLKMINSYGSLFMELEDLDYSLLSQGRAEVSSGAVRYGFSDNLNAFNNFGGTQSFGQLPKANPLSLALDLGVVYHHKASRKPLRSKNGTRKKREFDYDFRLSMSITDIGVLKFQYGQLSTAASELITNQVDPVNLNVVFARPTSLVELTENLSEFLITESLEGEYTMALPAASHINMDYNLGKGFFMNANVRVDLSGLLPADYKLHYYSNVTLTPRWESRNMGLYLPIVVNQLGNVRTGAAFRMGPLMFGSQDWNSLFAQRKRSLSFFFSINLSRLVFQPGTANACFSPWL